MKLFIMTDLEGAGGVTGPKDVLSPQGGRQFSAAVANLTHDVNAAIEGALSAGATEIVVLDGDGRRFTIDRDRLHPAARLFQGARLTEMAGFAGGYDAMFIVGAHAMVGTPTGVLNHTFSSEIIHNLWLNGRKSGEVGVWAAIAGAEGVPTVLVTGDRAVCCEARDILPDVETVVVKEGLSRYHALCYPSVEVAKAITAAARVAMKRRGQVRPYRPSQPFELRIELNDTHLADRVAIRPGVERIDGRTVQAHGDDLNVLLALLWP